MRNHMMLAAQMATAGRASTRVGEVTSYDPSTYSAVVSLKPDNSPTGWLPVTSPWIGNGWGMYCPPSIGDLVEVQFQEDDLNAGFIVGRFYNDADRPLAVESGECWLFHQTGSFIKLTNDGKLLINGHVEIDATAPTINITATGNIAATAGGNVSVIATGTATIQAASIILKNAGSALRKICTDLFVTLYNGHTHPQSGGGNTLQPNEQATAGTHTTNIVQAE